MNKPLIQIDNNIREMTDLEYANYLTQKSEGEKERTKEGLKQSLNALDLKRIRPTAEGDASYLATLNTQAAALRQQLQALG